jgi:phosphopantetheine--protein transferase-like protein
MKMISSQNKPAPSEVHIWTIPLRSAPGDAVRCLSQPEIARLAHLAPAQKRAFAASHVAIRQILASYFGVRASRVPLNSPYGCAPTVPGLMLSLSHSDDLALLAISTGRVGIDLEPISAAYDEDLELLAEATLTDAELSAFQSTPPRNRPLSWLRSWVRKEASLKALGQGISDRAPSEIDVSSDRCELALRNLDFEDEYFAALATEEPVSDPTIREWSLE